MSRVLRSFFSLAVVAGMGAPLGAQTTAGGSQPGMAAFGGALAVAEGDVLVGEPQNQMRPGLVYVYRDTGDGWTEVAQLRAPDAENGDGFGAALATGGSTLLVGGAGGVFVFERQGDAWSQTGRIEATDVAEGDAFGASLALDGDLALVGAPAQADQAGAVYLFRRGADGWTQLARATAADGGSGDLFGASLALSGERVVVGSPGREGRTGAAHVFDLDAAAGTLTPAGTLTADGGSRNEQFGASVAFHGGRVLVGAPFQGGTVGAVFAFEAAEDGSWESAGRLLPFDGSRRHGFGSALAVSDALWVGAPGAGAAYAFQPRAGGEGFVSVSRVTPEGETRGSFGSTVAVGEGVAVFGLPGADFGAGQAAIFQEDASGTWSEVARIMSPPEGFDRVAGGQVDCTGGAAAAFECQDVDLVSFLPVSDMGADRGVRTNDVWGWTDSETGKEYALVGMTNQAAFVDISDPANPVYVGRLPMTEGANASSWRDIKVHDDHAFIVSDGAGNHGMQVFDLTRLRDFDGEPTTFEADALYDRIASAHNIVVNEDTGFAYAVGSSSGGESCGGGLHMIDVRDPKNPTFAGCFADPQTGRASTGYSHDAQCVTYQGPDEEYQGREICLGSNETALSIADVTDKANPVALSRATYPNVGYSHQGWLTDDHRYFYMNDELDELQGLVTATRTMIWDVSDLEDPQLVGEYMGTSSSSDHNLYIEGDRMYQSNYQSGLRILDISDRGNPVEVAFFDTVPYGTNTPGFGGSWSNYPYFESGVVIVTSGNEGLFILQPRDERTIS